MKEKLKTVFIFGAGASTKAGGPLMSKSLDKSEKIHRQSKRRQLYNLEDAENSFEDVFDAIAELQGIHYKSYIELDNIEISFGAIEMAQNHRKTGSARQESNCSTKELHDYPDRQSA